MQWPCIKCNQVECNGICKKCARCGELEKEHHYNGACYGMCGEFMPGGMYKGQWDQGDGRDVYPSDKFVVKIPVDYVSEPILLGGVLRRMSSIKDIQVAVHQNGINHGWWEGVTEATPELILSKLALIHSEVSEALEDVRVGRMVTELNDSGKPEGFPTEIADVVIRCMDLAEWLKIDLQKEILQKHEYNLSRPYKHGNKKL